jgi:large subunit ribosomal protein L6e
LSGRFKGRRVVFLKQLQSGLLLVTGPYKVNGVPLRRINQTNCIVTSTKVDLTGVKVDSVNDSYFAKSKLKKTKSGDFFVRTTELSEEEKAKIQEKKKRQTGFDEALLKNVKKVEYLAQYLKTRFTLRKNMKPHDMAF